MTRIILLLILCLAPLFSDLVKAENIDSLIEAENKIAVNMLQEGRYEEGKKKLQRVLDLKLRYWVNDYRNLGNTYINLGVLNNEFYLYDEAIKAFDKAEEYFKKSGEEPIKIATLLNNEAALFMKRRDFSRALIYLKEALNYIVDENDQNRKIRVAIYGNLSATYAFFGNKDETEKYLKFAENSYKGYPESMIIAYENLTQEVIYKDNYDLARRNFQKREYLIENTSLANNPMVRIRFFIQYAKFLADKLGNYQQAFDFYEKAERIASQEFDKSNPIFTTLYEYIGTTIYNLKNFDAALQNFQTVLILSSKDFENRAISANPTYEQIINENSAYSAAKYKATILFKQFLENGNINTLNSSLDACDLAIKILNKIRLRIDSESSQFLISAKEKEIYYLGQQIANHMYKVTGDKKYQDLAFQINEKGRAFSLLSSIRSQTAMEYGDLPHELTRRETDLNRKISVYNEKILNEKQLLEPNEKKIKIWEEKLFTYSRDYDNLLQFIEKNYPKYYRLKYDNSVISMEKVREKIPENDIIVEYSLMDTTLYTYIISKENSTILESKVDTSLAGDCNRFYNILTTQNFSYDVMKTYKDYASLGYKLYKELFAPVESYVEDKNVIIIPDGAIFYVPFEAMLTRPVKKENFPDYYSAPYLIYDHAFSTSYSSTLHFSEMPHNGEARQEILAFAPSYENLTSYSPGFELLRQSDREELISIPGVKKEVQKISKEMKSKVFEDQEATETNFKKNAANYKILHLAMHTILDDNNPLYSKLAFSQVRDSLNDNFLHTYEIYNLKLNASLAVLSSCGSGYGKFQEGEGMQSLARGFTYAGCPSILMTLWEVADQSTVSVMDRFYYYLDKGQSKSEALRNSKLDFLADADLLKSNPFFWSSFVIIGDNEPVYTDSTWKMVFGIMAFLIPIPLIIFLLYRKYKRDASIKNA